MDVTKYKPGKPGGSVIAYVSFFVPEWGLHLNNMVFVRSRTGHTFFSPPSRSYQNESGETKYAYHFFFEKSVSERFQDAAKRAVEEYVAARQPQADDAQDEDECPF